MTTARLFASLNLVSFLLLAVLITPVSAAVSVTKSSLTGGTLQLEGSGAVPASLVTASSTASVTSARADNRGRWKIRTSNFSAPNCRVTVDDGTVAVTLSPGGCVAAPNQPPVANAGPDQTLVDTDGDGFAVITYDGTASRDADGTITGYSWVIQGATSLSLGTSPTVRVTQAVGTYTATLTVTDNNGAQSVDTVTVTITAAPPAPTPTPPPPSGVPQGSGLGVLQSDQAWSGSFDSALMGASVASAGDVNGDGFDDVIVGALGYDAPGGLFDEGAVFVFLGGPDGVIGNSPATAHAAIIGNTPGSEFGTSVSGAGDINNDGYDDIIVGAPQHASSGLFVSGVAYVFLGGPAGITANSPADADHVLESLQIQAWFGYDVAGAGDVNGDGFDDIIVGAPRYGQPFSPPIPNQGSGEQGAAFVFLGSAAGIVGTSPATAHAVIFPVSPGSPSQTRAFFGTAVDSAGDINADGYADVIIGAPGWNQDRPLTTGTVDPPAEGAAFVFLGGPAGINGRNPTGAATRIEGNKLLANMGAAVAGIGDVNADGFDDVLVGAPGYPAGDPLLARREGAAFLYYGGPAGIAASGATQANWSVQGSITGEQMGRAVGGTGDVNGDGLADVIIAARTFSGAIADDAVSNGSARLTGEGIAYVYTGITAGITAATVTVQSGQEAASTGYSLGGPADVNGDALSDLIVGVPGYSGDQAREGAAFVHLSDGTSPSPPAN